jgi:hypothetical protein
VGGSGVARFHGVWDDEVRGRGGGVACVLSEVARVRGVVVRREDEVDGVTVLPAVGVLGTGEERAPSEERDAKDFVDAEVLSAGGLDGPAVDVRGADAVDADEVVEAALVAGVVDAALVALVVALEVEGVDLVPGVVLVVGVLAAGDTALAAVAAVLLATLGTGGAVLVLAGVVRIEPVDARGLAAAVLVVEVVEVRLATVATLGASEDMLGARDRVLAVERVRCRVTAAAVPGPVLDPAGVVRLAVESVRVRVVGLVLISGGARLAEETVRVRTVAAGSAGARLAVETVRVRAGTAGLGSDGGARLAEDTVRVRVVRVGGEVVESLPGSDARADDTVRVLAAVAARLTSGALDPTVERVLWRVAAVPSLSRLDDAVGRVTLAASLSRLVDALGSTLLAVETVLARRVEVVAGLAALFSLRTGLVPFGFAVAFVAELAVAAGMRALDVDAVVVREARDVAERTEVMDGCVRILWVGEVGVGGWDVDEGLREWEGRVAEGVREWVWEVDGARECAGDCDEGRRRGAGDSALGVGERGDEIAGLDGVLPDPCRVTRPTPVRRGRGGPLITCPCRLGVGEFWPERNPRLDPTVTMGVFSAAVGERACGPVGAGRCGAGVARDEVALLTDAEDESLRRLNPFGSVVVSDWTEFRADVRLARSPSPCARDVVRGKPLSRARGNGTCGLAASSLAGTSMAAC